MTTAGADAPISRRPGGEGRRRSLLAFGWFAAIAAALLVIALRNPYHNWDMLAYVATSRALQTTDAGDIHRFTYRSVQASVPLETTQRLMPSVGDRFRRTMRADERAFAEQLPFYRVRIGYTALISLLHAAGMDVVYATHFVPAFSVFLSFFLLYAACRSRVRFEYVLILPVLALAFGAYETAILSTPDGLALLAIMISGLLFLEGNRLFLATLPLIVLIRTDLVLLVVPLLACDLVVCRSPRRRLETLASLAAALAMYLALNWYYGYPGWAAIFYSTFIERLPYPLSSEFAVRPEDYLARVKAGGLEALGNSPFLLWLALLLAAGLTLARRAARRSFAEMAREPWTVLLVVSAIYVPVHFLLFPVLWQRFFIGPYWLTALALCVGWSSTGHPGRRRHAEQHAGPRRRVLTR